ncbi:MAG: ABC transporter substrate-binding protein [Rhodospirillaceae bacterium]|nr:ABC transporter substrate-binding protein [Rhodospirillaceae bacterium]
MKTTLRLALLAGVAFVTAPASAQELRIGFLNTYTGGGAVLGRHQDNGWKLGLAHEGWTKDGDKLGGVPTRVFYGDDQQKTDAGLKEAEKLLKQDKVQILAGIIWSNVLMAVQRPTFANKTVLITTNAGASPMAGAACNPLFLSTSWNNDQVPEALGKRMSDDKLKSIYMLAPNYQAGKDMIAGVQRTLKGPKVVGQSLVKLGETDFQADISKLRASKPDAVFTFMPGAMAISFMKQWAASGANKTIKLYTVFSVDNATLPAIGDAAVGSYHTSHWSTDLPFPASKAFVKAYVAKFGGLPSEFAAQSYDAARLIAAALKATKGKFTDGMAMAKALRHTKYASTRGPYTYNVNGMPIQNYYKREVIKGPDGKAAIVSRGIVLKNYKDAYWEKCPANMRL